MSVTTVDEFVWVPKSSGEYWVFAGGQYLRMRISGSQDSQVYGLRPLAEWQSLKGLGHVDAILPVPGVTGEYWVFTGGQYLRMRISGSQDSQVYGLKPLAEWQSLS